MYDTKFKEALVKLKELGDGKTGKMLIALVKHEWRCLNDRFSLRNCEGSHNRE